MNVGELKRALENHLDDLEVIVDHMSDYALVEPNAIKAIEAVDQDYYIMRVHTGMSAKAKAKVKSYLLIGTA